ncbi:Heat shock protein DnaJ cysteine-rich domain superfamily [Arabidopsis thaliana x Arabidopsis arenosa]|uniref:Heat shock protein DnaJ cysteine-rich domain superfamily n=1 Tax=Arabidopsis thaliana x Arabidopsis arenosa TaxID=1240361 RepID=A0A8T2GIU9_9BRAS|nr:Heat shock protein DnaJ cysteine-rich domain superfamily [Arabidopsis thaliana x Arabidopsis arenosa]
MLSSSMKSFVNSSKGLYKQIFKSCETCGAKGAIECPGCKGTGKNKKNGNMFERWKCFDCQGFGMKSCPKCGKGGLTPEQRGER